MIRKNIILILFFFVLLAPAPYLWGHGIQLTIEKKYPFVMVNAKYHGGKNLSDAGVSVFFETGKKEFQKGATDSNGNFSFSPDKPGDWTIIVDDLTGHRKKTGLKLEPGFFIPPVSTHVKEIKEVNEEKKTPPVTKNGFTKDEFLGYMLKIALGVLLILAITVIMYRLRKRQGE